MDKELTPLEALERLYRFNDLPSRNIVAYLLEQENLPTYRKIIETALKEKEQQDNVLKTLKEVIEFSQMLPHIEPNKDNGFDIMSAVSINIQRDIENKERELLRKWVLDTCFPKELKVLEIIKKRECLFKGLSETTQEEYDLLKEVFRDER